MTIDALDVLAHMPPELGSKLKHTVCLADSWTEDCACWGYEDPGEWFRACFPRSPIPPGLRAVCAGLALADLVDGASSWLDTPDCEVCEAEHEGQEWETTERRLCYGCACETIAHVPQEWRIDRD